jgi:signal transduction histidine kinase
VRASGDGGVIDVQAFSENGETIVTVTDRGKGMEAQELSKITEPFYRVDKGRARADGGVGLGLAICARICELHGARLEIASKAGAGYESEGEKEAESKDAPRAEAGSECESKDAPGAGAETGTKVTIYFTSP